MTDILTAPCRANERSKTVYYFDGYVSVEVISGSEEQQRAAFLLVSQAQEMARILRHETSGHDGNWDEPCACDMCKVLRAAGVSDKALDSEGR